MICDNVLEYIGHTPMIRLNRMNDPEAAEVLVKYEGLNVGGSIKTRTAYNMIKQAIKDGKIKDDTIIVEPTSGNQGIGLALIGAAYISIGIFCSACTESQSVAAVFGFGVLMCTTFISSIASQLPFEFLTKLADKVSFAERYYTFTYGIFDISNVLFFVSAAFVFLFLTVRVVEKRRYS